MSTSTRTLLALALLLPSLPARAEDPPPAPAGDEAETDSDDAPADDAVEEVVVTGTRTAHALGDSPVATEVIDRETIERSGAVTAVDLLERAVGVQVNRNVFGSALSLQGMNPDHTLVLIDGQRIVGRKEGILDLSRIDVERIERIEIVKGPGSTLYGSDAMGGVINIVTRDAEATAASGEFRGGGLATFDGTLGVDVKRDAVGSHTSLGWHTGDAYDLDPATAATDGVSYDTLEGSEKLTLDLGANHDVTAQASYLTRTTAAVEEQPVSNAQFLRNNAVEEFQASLGDRWVASKTSTLSATVYTTAFRDQFFYDQALSNELDQYEDNRQTLAELELQYDQVLGPHVITVGAEGLHEWYASPRLTEVDGHGERSRGAVFVQDEWALFHDKLDLLPGFRLDADSQFGTAPTPRLGAALFVVPELAIRANAGLGFRAPDFKELYLVFENPAAGYVAEGNPDLRPEKSIGFTLGVALDLDRVHASAQAFRNDITDLIDYTEYDPPQFSATQYFRLDNVAKARTQGVDLSASVTPIDGIDLRAGGELLDARNVTEGDLAEGLPLENRAPVTATFGIALAPPRTGLALTVDGSWNGVRRFYELVEAEDGDTLEVIHAPSIVLLDARLGWKLTRGAEVFVGGENLIGAGDDEYNQVKPRWLYAGLRGRFGAR